MEHTKGDHALAAIKATLSTLGPPGAVLASLIGDYVPNAIQRSLKRTGDLLTARLEQLEDRIDADAVDKDEFAELFLSCYMIILRTTSEEKRRAAANLIANILLCEGDEAKISYSELDHYARSIDALPTAALSVLAAAYKLAQDKGNDRPFEFQELSPCVPGDRDLAMGLVAELNAWNLVHLGGAPPIPTKGYGNYPVRITRLGKTLVERLLEDDW